MLYYNQIDLRAGLDPVKSNKSNECIVCHYWYFRHGFKILFDDAVP